MFAPDPSATAFGALVCSVWLAFLIGWLVAKSCIVSNAAGWFRRQTVPARVLAACTLLAAVAVGGNKGGGNAPQGLPRPPPLLRAAEPAAEPAIAPVTVRTNGVVLRAPLGMVPEANWTNAGTQSRFWHDALPGGGRVLTWENALLDRLPGRRVSLQVELLPTGDCSFRYDFHDGLDPPPTNFAMGAQMGTNGVNALSVFGTNLLAATVWNVDGAPVANGVSVADLLCTNGVLRTPAAFEIFWRNTTGIDPDADTDGDGLSDGAEIFLWETSPDCADTDADGTPDGVELMSGTDPLDADEDGNGVPDGLSPDAYAANPLWAEGAEDANLSIVLRSAIPPGASATLVVGGLALPLRNPATYGLSIPPRRIRPVPAPFEEGRNRGPRAWRSFLRSPEARRRRSAPCVDARPGGRIPGLGRDGKRGHCRPRRPPPRPPGAGDRGKRMRPRHGLFRQALLRLLGRTAPDGPDNSRPVA